MAQVASTSHPRHPREKYMADWIHLDTGSHLSLVIPNLRPRHLEQRISHLQHMLNVPSMRKLPTIHQRTEVKQWKDHPALSAGRHGSIYNLIFSDLHIFVPHLLSCFSFGTQTCQIHRLTIPLDRAAEVRLSRVCHLPSYVSDLFLDLPFDNTWSRKPTQVSRMFCHNENIGSLPVVTCNIWLSCNPHSREDPLANTPTEIHGNPLYFDGLALETACFGLHQFPWGRLRPSASLCS